MGTVSHVPTEMSRSFLKVSIWSGLFHHPSDNGINSVKHWTNSTSGSSFRDHAVYTLCSQFIQRQTNSWLCIQRDDTWACTKMHKRGCFCIFKLQSRDVRNVFVMFSDCGKRMKNRKSLKTKNEAFVLRLVRSSCDSRNENETSAKLLVSQPSKRLLTVPR